MPEDETDAPPATPGHADWSLPLGAVAVGVGYAHVDGDELSISEGGLGVNVNLMLGLNLGPNFGLGAIFNAHEGHFDNDVTAHHMMLGGGLAFHGQVVTGLVSAGKATLGFSRQGAFSHWYNGWGARVSMLLRLGGGYHLGIDCDRSGLAMGPNGEAQIVFTYVGGSIVFTHW